ncbi:MAG: hypothetical protein JKY12_06505 [Sneathiella sp.]|nr:hypothetical protein [Sneathiella sp.]
MTVPDCLVKTSYKFTLLKGRHPDTTTPVVAFYNHRGTEKLTKWGSNDGQTIKSWLSGVWQASSKFCSLGG